MSNPSEDFRGSVSVNGTRKCGRARRIFGRKVAAEYSSFGEAAATGTTTSVSTRTSGQSRRPAASCRQLR
jgi:hypothetical protein